MPEFAKLLTRAGKNLPEIPWNVYPRPLLKRDSFFCLNGEWSLCVTKGKKTFYDGKILVPFPPESLLSNVGKTFEEGSTLCYTKTFSLPYGFNRGKVILHFGAVDQFATVFFNGEKVATHEGGYTPFSVDVTSFLKTENTLQVQVVDNLSNYVLPYGKQKVKRGGMWYTPVSGIWQTVWMESVPFRYIQDLSVQVDGDQATFNVSGVENASITIFPPNGEQIKILAVKGVASLKIPYPAYWSEQTPNLYTFTVKTDCDEVCSYFALRTLSIKEVGGLKRLCVNDKPVFFHGLLDQGYWSDGLFLPADPKEYTKEILRVKELGFNTLRKHIKIEPQVFYAECDRLGIYVFQDMINNGDYAFFRDTLLPTFGILKKDDTKIHTDEETRKAFLLTMQDTVELLKPHPSVCYWTIFNEGWGQFESQKCFEILKTLDSTRFIDTTSGWFRCGDSDVDSRHVYFRKVKLQKCDKPIVLSEFGGYALKTEGHVFNPSKAYGYAKCKDRQDFVNRVRSLYLEQVVPAIKQGLCASIYTQVSDVEDEINGIFTYDREVSKLLPQEFADIKNLLDTEIKK